MQLAHWQPLREMDDFVRRASRLFNHEVPAQPDEDGFNVAQWTPSADISETKKEYLIKAELPDVKKEDIKVSVEGDAITIEGERKLEKDVKDETFHRIESLYGKFTRTFALPNNVDSDKVRAECKDGVLRVHLPKLKDAGKDDAKKIEVK